jgi:CRP-like cAMP-binding protein
MRVQHTFAFVGQPSITDCSHRLALALHQLWHSASGWAESGAGLRPWALTQCLQFESAPVRYTASLYWALTTMATVGFGDITPGSNMERCFAMALQLVAGVLQGVVFGNIGVAIAGFDRAATAQKSARREARALAAAAELPPALTRRLLDAATAQASASFELDVREALAELSGSVRRDAEAATEGARALAAAPLVRDATPPLPQGFTAAVARRLRVLALPHGELATSAGDADGAAFLLLRGAVRLTTRHRGGSGGGNGNTTDAVTTDGATAAAPPPPAVTAMTTSSMLLHAPALFGDGDAVLWRRAAADARSRGGATLLAIDRDALDAALDEFPEALAPLTASCLAREADADAEAHAAAAAQAAQRLNATRRSGYASGGGSGSSGGSGGSGSGSGSGSAILDASVPMLAALRASGVGRSALRRDDGGGTGASAAAAPAAAARWGKAGTAARMVVRLAGVAHESEQKRAAAQAQAAATLTPRRADALAAADWSVFNARLQALVAAQTDAFAACGARLDAVGVAQGAIAAAAATALQ